MSMLTAQALRCALPPTVGRGYHGQARAMAAGAGQTVRTLPPARQRGAPPSVARAAALSAAGISCRLPAETRRGGGPAIQQGLMSQAMPQQAVTLSLPMEVRRGAPSAFSANQGSPNQGSAGQAHPEPRPGPEPSSRPAAPRDRAPIPVASLLRIVERVARGISGAAGYAYMGEDPQGAGLRYGLLGLRLDTGDMGSALRLAVLRDGEAVHSALGPDGQALLDTVQAPTREARLAPVAGKLLWDQPWKSVLSQAATTNVFRAGQNEYCVEELLRPGAERLLVHAALASGTALAMALDLLAELGREAGLAALESALSGQGAESVPALRDALVVACPPCRLRLQDLARDKALADWRPDDSEVMQ